MDTWHSCRSREVSVPTTIPSQAIQPLTGEAVEWCSSNGETGINKLNISDYS